MNLTKQVIICIWFFDIIHYHAARLNAFKLIAEKFGYKVVAYSLRDRAPDRPSPSYDKNFEGELRVLVNHDVPLNSAKTVRLLLKSLSRDNPDVVIIPGYESWPSLASLAWCKMKSRVVVLMSESHRSDYVRPKWKEGLKRHLVKRYHAALVGGSLHLAYAKELGLAPEVIFKGYDVVDNLFWQSKVDEIRKDPESWRRKMNLPAYYFIASKRFIPKKNIEGLIHAYALYQRRVGGKAWHLVVCGSGEMEPRIKNLINQLGPEKYIYLPGYQDAESLTVFYGLASAFVHASSYAEQWGLVVNEAMAAGLPVLVSRICGCAPDLVHDGENGFTFDPYDVEGLARLMAKMSSGEVNLQAMGEASRRIIANWTPEVFAENLLKAVEAALSAKKARNRWGRRPSIY